MFLSFGGVAEVVRAQRLPRLVMRRDIQRYLTFLPRNNSETIKAASRQFLLVGLFFRGLSFRW